MGGWGRSTVPCPLRIPLPHSLFPFLLPSTFQPLDMNETNFWQHKIDDYVTKIDNSKEIIIFDSVDSCRYIYYSIFEIQGTTVNTFRQTNINFLVEVIKHTHRQTTTTFQGSSTSRLFRCIDFITTTSISFRNYLTNNFHM